MHPTQGSIEADAGQIDPSLCLNILYIFPVLSLYKYETDM